VADDIYRPDLSLRGKLRRRLVRRLSRRAATIRPARPMVSFAFDDAPASALTTGRAILEQRGLRATYFIAAGLAGSSGHMGRFANRDEILAAASAGHEIGCHTYSHLDCGRAKAREIEADLDRSRETLTAWGLPCPATFAYPYGDVSAASKRLANRFTLARALHPGLVDRGSDLNQAPAVGIEGDDGEQTARRWLARVQENGGWLILFTHGVEPEPTEFSASADALTRLADEALARGLEVVTVAEGTRRMGAAA
jgi:peptidoglycan/xylan/chitin deacetylase (PgdA/CDA1 family)